MKATTYRQELESTGKCVAQTVGISMEPLLHANMSTVYLERTTEPLKVMDIVLYENDEGEYILHRIWKIRGDELLLRTDNGLTPERVHRSQVLGVCKGYYRDASDEYTEIGSREDRRYLRQLHIRYMRKKIKHALQTIIRT